MTGGSYLNINITLKCHSCGDPTNCRIGMSNRPVQPLRFACQTCAQTIDLVIRPTSADIEGADQIETIQPFDPETNFVDLHLDFPVTFEKYVMGETPFMRAAQRIGHDEMQLHAQRLRYLDERHDDQRVFETVLKHYVRDKKTPFKLVAKKRFDIEVISEKPEDYNAALYNLLTVMMWPFALPGANEDAVDLFLTTLGPIHKDSRPALRRFVEEILTTRFLTKLQHDCLSIYPKILDAELALRPALFLDFDEEYKSAPLAMRVSTDEFQSYKDLYKDIAELVSRQFVLVAAVNNLDKRADHDAFLPGIGLTANGRDFTPANLDEFAKVDFGRKMGFIDDPWYEMQDGAADNQLRNAIAHFKTDYDEVSQVITYHPRKDGLEASAPRTLSFLEFMSRVLIAYREMHRLHHLIKALFYYYYLHIDGESDRPQAK